MLDFVPDITTGWNFYKSYDNERENQMLLQDMILTVQLKMKS